MQIPYSFLFGAAWIVHLSLHRLKPLRMLRQLRLRSFLQTKQVAADIILKAS